MTFNGILIIELRSWDHAPGSHHARPARRRSLGRQLRLHRHRSARLAAAARVTFVVLPAIVFVRFPRGSFGRILLIGVFMTAGQFALLYTAMSLGLPAGLASIVIQIQAAFTVIVAALALREVPRRRQVL